MAEVGQSWSAGKSQARPITEESLQSILDELVREAALEKKFRLIVLVFLVPFMLLGLGMTFLDPGDPTGWVISFFTVGLFLLTLFFPSLWHIETEDLDPVPDLAASNAGGWWLLLRAVPFMKNLNEALADHGVDYETGFWSEIDEQAPELMRWMIRVGERDRNMFTMDHSRRKWYYHIGTDEGRLLVLPVQFNNVTYVVAD